MVAVVPMPGETPRCWRCQKAISTRDAIVIGATMTGTAVILHEACGDAS